MDLCEFTSSKENGEWAEEIWEAMAKEGADIAIDVPILGCSMKPLLRPKGDFVKIVPLRRELMIGDIIIFRRDDGRLIMHRVWKLTKTHIQTIGDNCEWPDREITYDAVFGLVTHIVHGKHTIYVDNKFWRFVGRILTKTIPVRILMFKYVKQPLWRVYKKLQGK